VTLAITPGMKHLLVCLMFLTMTSCAHKVEVDAPRFVRADKFAYTKSDDGRVFIVTTNTKDFDDAMKRIQPGPATVDKFDLWVITPASGASRGETRHRTH